jgi:flagellar hook protein FlgE
MYSGVAGMKANQGRMDVIGNNISNANTYGFKSGRATFRDMYYQQVRGASAGTQTRGSINPSMVGYGAQLSSIDLMMDSSSMTSTGFALDCAITGEGFFQVMDPDGNIYYTKAGMLDIDQATGAVIDSNGNFVLGTSATDGKLNSSQPGSNKIMIAVNPVQASIAKLEKEIGGRTLIIESTNMTKDANVSFAFTKGSDMPDGLNVRAVMDSTTSVINIQLNPNAEFTDLDMLNTQINDAITQAYGGEHPGGTYSFRIEPNPFEDENGDPVTLTGKEIIDTASAEYEGGNIKAELPAGSTGTLGVDAYGRFLNGFKFVETGLKFSGEGETQVTLGTDADGNYTVLVTVTPDGGTPTYYGATISKSRAEASNGGNTVLLSRVDQNGAPVTGADIDVNDTITISYPNAQKIDDAIANMGGTAIIGTAEASYPTKNLGWGQSTFTLKGGTEYHTQDTSNLTGISVGADGTITGTSDAGLQILGRIDLATFGNAKGLMQTGNTYFSASASSGPAKITIAGENGTGAIKNSALEMSNVDLAQEFSDMIVTQRGFQASSRMITVSDTMLEELINLKR